MFGCRSFLMFGNGSPADIKSLTEEGYEIIHSRFGFMQGVDVIGNGAVGLGDMIDNAAGSLIIEVYEGLY
jgi:hypothetical protein